MKSAIKKTLLVTTYFPPQIGGAESYLYNVYSRLEASKIFVLAQQKNNSLEQEFDAKQSFKIYRTSFFDGKLKPSWLSMIKKVAKLIRDKNIETMHFGHYAHYVLIARILKMPYSVYFHGTDLKNYSCNIWQKAFMRFNLKKASTIITSSNFLKNIAPCFICSHLPGFLYNQLTPLFARYVHGGCAIIASYLPLYASFIASPFICHSGCPPEVGNKSQEYASIPASRNADVIIPDSSQAINTIWRSIRIIFYASKFW